MSVNLQPEDPFHQIKSFIISMVCVILLLITGGELIYSKLSKAPWPVQISVGVAVVLLVLWLYYCWKKKQGESR